MSDAKWAFSQLGQAHKKDEFTSGVEKLDAYLKNQARQDAKRYVTATYVLTELGSTQVIGYYTLSATSIRVTDLPEVMQKKLPRYPTLPATLLGRLAIDCNFQGSGLGEFLLLNGLERSHELSGSIASVAVVVDAKDDNIANFYTRYGFKQFTSQKHRLFLPMKTVARMKSHASTPEKEVLCCRN